MRPKRFAIALVVALALAAVTAAGAFGAATTTVEPWRTGTSAGGTTVLTGSQGLTASLASGTKAVFETVISSTTVKLEATELECVSCTILNSGGGAKGEGKLELKSIAVTPGACTLTGGVVLTNSLTMDWAYMIGTTAYAEIAPAAGISAPVFTFTLTGVPPCPAGTYKVIGNFFLQSTNATGIYATNQGAAFSKAINDTAGGLLKVGTFEGRLSGSAKFEAGGKFFGVE